MPIRGEATGALEISEQAEQQQDAAEGRFGGEELLQAKVIRGQIVFQFSDGVFHVRSTVIIAPDFFPGQREVGDEIIFSLFTAAAGLLFVFSGKPLLMRILLRPPETEVSTLLLFMMRELGGLALMLSVLLFFASRDPVRNVAIVNGLIVGLCILAITPLLSLYVLDIRRLYPGYLVWGRSLIRLALAAVLYFLRPRQNVEGQT